MRKFIFYIAYPLLWLVSKLPFPLFYLFSDFIYVIVYYLIGYRKKVVRGNLELCFPNKSSEELKKIEKAFYHHMCDMFLEMIKTLSISEKQLKERFVYKNIEELQRLEEQSTGIIVMCGHYASYEWATAINFYKTKNKGYAIYKKIKNQYFDKLIKDIRANLGTTLISSREVIPTMLRNKRDAISSSYYMISDQSPKKNTVKNWTNFMGTETPVFNGSEAMAKKLDFAVLYLKVEKVKRGFYEATLLPLAENPKETEDFEITTSFFNELEKQIRNQPEFYLWTHKRWKHQKKDF
jgi:KDO2-lipid IV(A) lauroyltransferase